MLACESFGSLAGGEFYDNCAIGRMSEDARDDKYCAQFWKKSAEIIKEKGGELSHFK